MFRVDAIHQSGYYCWFVVGCIPHVRVSLSWDWQARFPCEWWWPDLSWTPKEITASKWRRFKVNKSIWHTRQEGWSEITVTTCNFNLYRLSATWNHWKRMKRMKRDIKTHELELWIMHGSREGKQSGSYKPSWRGVGKCSSWPRGWYLCQPSPIQSSDWSGCSRQAAHRSSFPRNGVYIHLQWVFYQPLQVHLTMWGEMI